MVHCKAQILGETLTQSLAGGLAPVLLESSLVSKMRRQTNMDNGIVFWAKLGRLKATYGEQANAVIQICPEYFETLRKARQRKVDRRQCVKRYPRFYKCEQDYMEHRSYAHPYH